CAASTWSSAINARVPPRMAVSFPRKPRSTCPTWRSSTPRTASRRESASRSWRTARRCGWPNVREPSSMPEVQYTPRLRTYFNDVVRPRLTEQFGYKNPMQVPALDKVVLNMGIGEGVSDRKKVESAAADLALIAGQKAVITKSRKSIATFKLREDQ